MTHVAVDAAATDPESEGRHADGVGPRRKPLAVGYATSSYSDDDE